jgi:RNA polymerase sigma factor (sigma-70 family)
MQELDDTALLREYVERGSEEAFAALVTRHVNKVYSVALRLTGNPHSAEEITQAVFVILAKKSRHLGKRVILSGWLYQTARLTAVTFIRGGIRRARREQEAYMQTVLNENESDLSRRSETEADATWAQFAPLLDAAMARLNETDRHAVVLRFFDGKSLREVGAALGANEDAAKKRVSRALEKLHHYFSKRGVSSTTAIIAGMISIHSVQAAPAALAKAVTAAALAKGAMASGSTLTLVKGALKIMAWTKAKTTIVASACVLLAAGTTTIAIYNANKPIQGIPNNWSVISGEPDQWNWSNGVINGHSVTGDSILASGKEYRDVTLSAIVSTTNREASLAIHLQDAGNGYIILFCPDGFTNWPGRIDIDKRVSDSQSTIASYRGRVLSSLGQSAKIKVSAQGPWIEVRLNDLTILRVKDTTFASGYIGLRIFGDSSSPCDATYSNLTFH